MPVTKQFMHIDLTFYTPQFTIPDIQQYTKIAIT